MRPGKAALSCGVTAGERFIWESTVRRALGCEGAWISTLEAARRVVADGGPIEVARAVLEAEQSGDRWEGMRLAARLAAVELGETNDIEGGR